MFHLVARARPGWLLFTRWSEGLYLWHMLVAAFPEALAICVMPDHVHLILPHRDQAGRFYRVRSGYSRWLGHAVWARAPAPAPIAGEQHLHTARRYVALNPDRARLVADPLEWPLSTHRDRVGLAAPPAIPPSRTPDREHALVSADLTVRVEGTPLPRVRFEPVDILAVSAAVNGVCRAPSHRIRDRGPARRLFVQTAWIHEIHDTAHLAEATGLTRRQVQKLVAGLPPRGATLADPALDACVRAVGDPRFFPLDDHDLRRTARWHRYRDRRGGRRPTRTTP